MSKQDGQAVASFPPDTTVLEGQSSRLLATLFEYVEPGSRLKVLNIGPALPETIEFFSAYHCTLHIVDLLEESFPDIDPDWDEAQKILYWRETLHSALVLPTAVKFDLIFFWDVLNFLSREAIIALMDILEPHLHAQSRAHCFAVHNTDAPPARDYYGIKDAGCLSVRSRPTLPPNYQPHTQAKLASLLRLFKTDRSVLMKDRRTELVLKAVNQVT